MTPPGEIEVYSFFRKHLGPRYVSAGLGIQFHYNQEPGIHFKATVSAEYRESIIRGLTQAMSIRFPDFPRTGGIWIIEVTVDPVASSEEAFREAARVAVEQAFLLTASSPAADR
jgi:hypothetical protein